MALRAIYKQHHLNQKHSDDASQSVHKKSSSGKKQEKVILAIFGAVVLLGLGTGFILSRQGKTSSVGTITTTVSTSGKTTVGSNDSSTFKDSAEGTLQKGGISGDGTHNLVRDGGPSQTVYLISSVVDLDQFIGKKVKVWGQTIAAQKAAWLMDVGKVEIE